VAGGGLVGRAALERRPGPLQYQPVRAVPPHPPTPTPRPPAPAPPPSGSYRLAGGQRMRQQHRWGS
jgi:hypothetical protein